MPEDVKVSPIEVWNAVQETKKSRGWQFIMERYAKEGDQVLTELLDVNLSPGREYSKRDLKAFQMEALGKLAKVLEDMKLEAEHEIARQSVPTHKGV
jgi:hypothetical protein